MEKNLKLVKDIWSKAVPTRALLLLFGIGILDLLMTAILHAQGKIVELNPLMKPFIESSEILFALVKGLTLVGCWIVMARYAKVNLKFVRTAALVGSATYVTIWCIWFIAGSASVV